MEPQRARPINTAKTDRRKPSEPCARAPQPARQPNHPILGLQRIIGNQATQQLLKSGAIQAKLTMSRPDDVYEQEADRAADEVMRMPGPVIQPKPT